MKFHGLLFNACTLRFRRNLGPYRLAHFLREEGWDIEVCEWVPFWPLEKLKEYALSRVTSDTKFFGFSGHMCYWDDNLNEFAGWLKQQWPNITIIYGGQSRPQMDSKYIDIYISGYSEVAIKEVLKYIAGNGTISDLRLDANWLLRGKKVIDANVAFDLAVPKSLMVKYQDRDYIFPDEWLIIEFSRGCKFECVFCNHPVLGVKGDTSRSQEDFIEQVQDAYDRFGSTRYYVADETFNDRTEKIVKFADAVERLPFEPFFHGFIRSDLLVAREEDRHHLARMNFRSHFYGVETFNHASGKLVGKGMNPEKHKQGLIDVRRYFETQGNGIYKGQIALVLGLPHETWDTLNSTWKWLNENWAGQAIDPSPLQISKDDMLDKPSIIDREWRNWGYRESNQPLEGLNFVQDELELTELAALLNWENDQFNFNDMRKLADQWMDDGMHTFTPHAWAWEWPLMVVDNDLKKAMNVKMSEIFGLDDRHLLLVDAYISKKLN